MTAALIAALVLAFPSLRPSSAQPDAWPPTAPIPVSGNLPSPTPVHVPANVTVRLNLPVPAPARQDRWFGEDKQRHLAMAFFTTTFGHAAARVAGIEAGTATVLGAAAATVASVGKEVFDRRAGGPFSFRDLVWDAAGIALGVVLVGASR